MIMKDLNKNTNVSSWSNRKRHLIGLTVTSIVQWSCTLADFKFLSLKINVSIAN